MVYRLIVNPASGVVDKETIVQQVCGCLKQKGVSAEVAYTLCARHACELTRRAVDDGVDAVITVGGDGTVNEVASTLVNTGIPMGIIPCGSGNGLARHLGISQTVSKAIDVLLDGNIFTCDAAMVNGRYFFCTSGIGFDADVSREFANSEGRRGFRNYIRSVIKCAAHYQPLTYRISVDDKKPIEVKAMVIAVCNAAQYGNNAFIAPDASITDGMLDVTIIKDGNPFMLARDVVQMFAGTLREQRSSVHCLRGRNLIIESDEMLHYHIDGDPMPSSKRLVYRNLPGCLKVFSVGETKIQPIVTPVILGAQDILYNLGLTK